MRPMPIPQRSLAWLLVWLLLALGLCARLAPLADQDGRLFSQWPTEDGYYMLTIARHIGLGHGMSTADATMVTNGVQPLATLLWALPYAITGGDKVAGVAGVLLLECLMAILSAVLLYRLGRRLVPVPVGGDPRWLPALATSLWFASAQFVADTMNTLETGLYVLTVLAAANLLLRQERLTQVWSGVQSLLVGILLGLVFLARNDGAFFIFAYCLTYLFMSGEGVAGFRTRLPQVLIFGTVSVLVASPWLIFNYMTFGHVMPISGISEGLGARFAGNLDHLPQALVEAFLVVLPIPEHLERLPAVLVLCWLLVALLVTMLAMLWRRGTPLLRSALMLAGTHLLLLSLFYALFFGAPHFMSRYLFPVTPFIALFSTALGWRVLTAISPRGWPLPALAGVSLLALLLVLNLRIYRLGAAHPHHQTMDWVRANVPAATWIGAAQSGYLGYFHDRTLNLDGKVNFAALKARLREHEEGMPGALQRYIVEDTDIRYLVDWHGLLVWMQLPVMRRHFEVVVADPSRNLVVLRRRD